MNYRLLSKMMGLVALLIGGMMLVSLPWAIPQLGQRHPLEEQRFETAGFVALVGSFLVSMVCGLALLRLGRGAHGQMYRKEAMAVVGLSWLLATVLGALPFYFSGTYRSPSVRLMGVGRPPLVFAFHSFAWRQQWIQVEPLGPARERIVKELLEGRARGMSAEQLRTTTGIADAPELLEELVGGSEIWRRAILLPGSDPAPSDRYRIRWVRMGLVDSLFESQSGFSTTGATVIADLEDPTLVAHSILFWRSSTHFLGGLGIIVLFVSLLGHGSAGKALMRAEMPGPTKEGATARMQHTAWLFAATYVALNIVLAVILSILGLSVFDALCHAFGTMATGGFSTYNTSLGFFKSPAIDYVVVLFMIVAGSNFTLLYLLVIGRPMALVKDLEWQTYIAVILGITVLVVAIGLAQSDFGSTGDAVRYGLFQVVSIMTTTGFGTHDFDQWNSFGRGVLFLLMFVGGCAGSTGGGLKVIRHILFLRILRLEIELAYRPSVVRPLHIGGRPVDQEMRRSILVYFGLILVIFVFSWMFVVTVEPDATWGASTEHKLIDSASGVAATLNNIGPGLGTVGATQNYTYFSPVTKILFVWLMMLGRLELFAILVLFSPRFWRAR